MYKAIFIDIDGTLRDNNNKISERTISAINKVIEKGILVILCSGRPKKYVEAISRECNASRYIITSNGGIIYDYQENKIIHKSTIEKQACIELFKLSEQFNTTVIMDTEEMIEKIENVEIKQEIKSFGDNNTSKKESMYYFIGNKEACKGNAIKAFCEILLIDLKDTVAIGDDFNDISMFKVVGHSVVMGNATDEVKKCADEITLSNEDDGVAVFLENLFV